jgi:dihydropteroate synthase
MTKTYLRPLGLLFGRDARAAMADGRGAALGGMDHIAFTGLEVISRKSGAITRRVEDLANWRGHPLVEAINRRRPALAGLGLEATRLMGIVNVTPDSFSDGGQHGTAASAIAHGHLLAEEGAEILDIGGESTRPGSEAVPESEEMRRVLPVLEGLAGSGAVLSLDTRKAAIMRAGAEAGASLVNDVSALTYDPDGLTAVRETGLPVVLMHAQGDPRTMQLNPVYEDVALDVYDYLEGRVMACLEAGIPAGRLCVDPGIGFGKSFAHNLDLLNQLALLQGLGVGLLVGLSRKAFIGALTGEKRAGARVSGSVGGALQAAMTGCHILRVHDVKASREALAVFLAANDPDSAGL